MVAKWRDPDGTITGTINVSSAMVNVYEEPQGLREVRYPYGGLFKDSKACSNHSKVEVTA